ncbi:MAG TPA: PHP-associated domain-containing protein [Tepidiformaceae bacterium]|nr:PHP-associated domain-containing protein [Tepidiformaceae bacterium]
MGRADLHLHTRVSDGLASVEEVLAFVEHQTDMDVVAITDHEDVTGGLRAQELAAKHAYRFEVVPGAEITTRQGHLLALYIDRDVPSFRSVESTMEKIHGQGGIAIVPHPISWLTRSISERTLDRICERREEGVTFDAIELSNPSPAGRRTRERALRLNVERWKLPWAGGSDAHHLPHIGTGWTEFAGASAAELKAALEAGRVHGAMSRYPHAAEVGYGRIALGLAWGYSATPRKMLRGKWRSG